MAIALKPSRFVAYFQTQNGLDVDGIVGKITANEIMQVYDIPSKEALAHFLGEMCIESAYFQSSEENLNYGEEGLLKTFSRKRISAYECKLFSRQPILIASKVYAMRNGNGSFESRDGWTYRGMGGLQLTGKDNQDKFKAWLIKKGYAKHGQIIDIRAAEWFFLSGVFFFNVNNLWQYCNVISDSAILTISRAINLGDPNSDHTPNHLSERKEATRQFYFRG